MPYYYEGNKVQIQFWIDRIFDISEYDGELSKNHPTLQNSIFGLYCPLIFNELLYYKLFHVVL